MISLNTMYKRITLNKISLAFFLFSIVHCFTQAIIQSFLYSVDSEHSNLAKGIIQEANVPRREIPWLTGNPKEFKLQLCTDLPLGMTDNVCKIAFDSRQSSARAFVPRAFPPSLSDVQSIRRSSVTAEPSDNSSGQVTGVNISVDNRTAVSLSAQCTPLFTYPRQMFTYFVREDAVLIASQFHLIRLSSIVIVNESRPHLLAVFLARALVTSWSIYSTWRSGLIADYVSQLMSSANSPCGVDLFSVYFRTKIAFETSILILNVVGLLVSIFFYFKIFRMYDAQTYKNIGPPPGIIQIHRVFLAFFVCIQLSIFYLVIEMALWISELMHGTAAIVSTSIGVYRGLSIATTSLLIPWLVVGWFAVRHEKKKLMVAFLFLGVFYIVSWAVMFYTPVFRWTFVSWPFLATLTVSAFVMMIASCVLGVFCWRNFDKGLARYLDVEDALIKANFQPDVFTNIRNSMEKLPIDSMRINSTKFLVARRAIAF